LDTNYLGDSLTLRELIKSEVAPDRSMTTGFALKASRGKGSQFHFTLSQDMAMKNAPGLSGPK